jgi:hypothetical protein
MVFGDSGKHYLVTHRNKDIKDNEEMVGKQNNPSVQPPLYQNLSNKCKDKLRNANNYTSSLEIGINDMIGLL